jgi:hypothetical protein
MNYAHLVNELHVWELNASCESSLRKNLPNARIRITDSFREIESVKDRFDLIVIDNHQGLYGIYCEHFEMLPKALSVLDQHSVIILNIIPDMNELIKMYGQVDKKHLERRKEWYGAEKMKLEVPFIKEFYSNYFISKGFRVKELFIQKRNRVVSYLVAVLER